MNLTKLKNAHPFTLDDYLELEGALYQADIRMDEFSGMEEERVKLQPLLNKVRNRIELFGGTPGTWNFVEDK